jgi:hypothetical protein
MPATATRYTDALAYTQKVNGYTKDYQPTSTTLSLPQSIVDTWGFAKDYTYDYVYSDNGMLNEATLPAAGKFASEKMVIRYNEDGKPLSISGKDWYGSETVYSPYGQVLRSTLGAMPYRVWTQNTYDESTGELKEQSVHREKGGPNDTTADRSLVGGTLVSNRAYTYDPAGNVTSIQEKSVGIEERECFVYDPMGQLKSAWTNKEPATRGCSTPKNTDGTLNATAGDGSGYWQEYEYDLLGNRTKLTEKDLSGNAAKDAVSTYAYGKADGSQPHTLTKVSKTYTTPAGQQVKAEATRLYELTGETKTITSVENGDKQELSWTYDGQVDRITGQGSGGKTPRPEVGSRVRRPGDPALPVQRHGGAELAVRAGSRLDDDPADGPEPGHPEGLRQLVPPAGRQHGGLRAPAAEVQRDQRPAPEARRLRAADARRLQPVPRGAGRGERELDADRARHL